MHTHTHKYAHTYLHMHTYINIYVYTHINTHTWKHIYLKWKIPWVILINSLDIVQKRFREPEDTSVNITQKENRLIDRDKIWEISTDHDKQDKNI